MKIIIIIIIIIELYIIFYTLCNNIIINNNNHLFRLPEKILVRVLGPHFENHHSRSRLRHARPRLIFNLNETLFFFKVGIWISSFSFSFSWLKETIIPGSTLKEQLLICPRSERNNKDLQQLKDKCRSKGPFWKVNDGLENKYNCLKKNLSLKSNRSERFSCALNNISYKASLPDSTT